MISLGFIRITVAVDHDIHPLIKQLNKALLETLVILVNSPSAPLRYSNSEFNRSVELDDDRVCFLDYRLDYRKWFHGGSVIKKGHSADFIVCKTLQHTNNSFNALVASADVLHIIATVRRNYVLFADNEFVQILREAQLVRYYVSPNALFVAESQSGFDSISDAIQDFRKFLFVFLFYNNSK